METTSGSLGFTIPVQSATSSKEVKLTPAGVKEWQEALPLADLGETTKKVYYAISDCNKVTLKIKDRFAILELLHTTVDFCCLSMRKHYIGQSTSLTPQQTAVSTLSQTLQIEMANGYKLIIEQLAENPDSKLETTALPIALQRTSFYFNQIILRSYQLYWDVPKDIWRELHLVYQYIEKKKLTTLNDLQNDYKRILLFASSYPYQWQQNEQSALYRATEIWLKHITLKHVKPDEKESGFFVFDTTTDKAPTTMARGTTDYTDSFLTFDVHAILKRVEELLPLIEPNEFKARIAHNNEPEFALSIPVLRGLLKEWQQTSPRSNERSDCSDTVNVCIGLRATHFHVNHERPFQTGHAKKGSEESSEDLSSSTSLPSLGVEIEEEGTDSNGEMETNIEISEVSESGDESNTDSFSFQRATITNQSPTGYALQFPVENCPAAYPSELIGLRKEGDDTKTIEVCVIRWLKKDSDNKLTMGVERLSTQVQAQGIQLIKEGKSVGDFLRCLILESSLLAPILPFKANDDVLILQEDGETSQPFKLTNLLEITSSYKRFEYSERKVILTEEEKQNQEEESNAKERAGEQKHEGGKFDSLWSDL